MRRRKQNVVKVQRAAKKHRPGDGVSSHPTPPSFGSGFRTTDADAQRCCSVQANLRGNPLESPAPLKYSRTLDFKRPSSASALMLPPPSASVPVTFLFPLGLRQPRPLTRASPHLLNGLFRKCTFLVSAVRGLLGVEPLTHGCQIALPRLHCERGERAKGQGAVEWRRASGRRRCQPWLHCSHPDGKEKEPTITVPLQARMFCHSCFPVGGPDRHLSHVLGESRQSH